MARTIFLLLLAAIIISAAQSKTSYNGIQNFNSTRNKVVKVKPEEVEMEAKVERNKSTEIKSQFEEINQNREKSSEKLLIRTKRSFWGKFWRFAVVATGATVGGIVGFVFGGPVGAIAGASGGASLTHITFQYVD